MHVLSQFVIWLRENSHMNLMHLDCFIEHTGEQYQIEDLLMRLVIHTRNHNETTFGIHRIAPSFCLYMGAYDDSIFQMTVYFNYFLRSS